MADREIRTVTHRTPPLDIMPDEAVAAIRDATTEVLERTGIEVRSQAILAQLGAAGAVIDEETGRARFPREVQEGALTTVPPDLPLASREPGLDIVLDGTRGYLGVDGNAAEVVDLDTDQRRASSKADVAAGTLIGDALPQIGYIWQPAVSREMPVPSEPLHNLEANLNNTGKHIVMMTAVTPEQAEASAEMAAVAVGGDNRAPGAADPLGVPVFGLAARLRRRTARRRGRVREGGRPERVHGHADPRRDRADHPRRDDGGEQRRGDRRRDRAPAAGTGRPDVLRERGHDDGPVVGRGELRRARGPGVPEANAQLARAYGLRSMVGTFATGSKTSDWQGGVENGLSGFASWISGVDMASGAGLLYAARVFSAAQLILDAELWDLVCSTSEGVRGWDAESLAVDVIDAVQPGGHFLDQDHTLTHMREVWQSKMFHRGNWEDWEANGRPVSKDRAVERAREILETHTPYPLPDGAADTIRGIVERFEDEHVEAA